MGYPRATIGKVETAVLASDPFPRVVDPHSGRRGPAGDGARIPLGRSLFCLVDIGDAERVQAFPWHVRMSNKGRVPYVYRFFWAHGQSRNVYLHRYVMEEPAGLFVDHRNGDGLDNRRANLRSADHSQSNCNYPGVASTGFRGVYRKHSGRYQAEVQFRGKVFREIHDDPIAAARARDRMAREIQGEFARLNFPEAASC